MGGQIGFQDNPGGGSVFTVELTAPVERAPANPIVGPALRCAPDAPARSAVGEELRASGCEHRGARILLAEDNVVNAKIATNLLRKLGCSVDVAANGAEAVRALEQESYALVFMDCMMPEMDGYDATTRIRALATPMKDVPIVALTANVMAGDRERCLAAGMNDYLSKPIQRAELKRALDRWAQTAPPSTQRAG